MSAFYDDVDEVYEEEPIIRETKKRGRVLQDVGSSKRPRCEASASGSSTNMTLFEIVQQGKMAMTSVVDDWIETYNSNQSEGILDLLQFFISASGCKGILTTQMLKEEGDGFQGVIRKMTEEFNENGKEYPLVASGTKYKKFHSSFCDFVQALIRQCKYQIIYDKFMMNNVLVLLTELSISQVRAFRHTSSLAAMKLMTGLVHVALELSVSLDIMQRQYEAERNKNTSKRSLEKLDILLQKRKELEDSQSDIEEMLNGIFKGIFVHRYRDYVSDIRAFCMEEIGIWMKLFPKVFLTDSYLKYLGWSLYDKQKEVRSVCVSSLIELYNDAKVARDMELFTGRFKDRIISMTLDKDCDVAVLAVKLLSSMDVNCLYDTPAFTPDDYKHVCQLVFSRHRPVAVAASEFVKKQLFAKQTVDVGHAKSGRRQNSNSSDIINLISFFIDNKLHKTSTYLVDALWEVSGTLLRDWKCMTNLLLYDPIDNQDALEEDQEGALIDIMVCSIRQAVGVPPSGRLGYSKKLSSADRRAAMEDRVRLTEHFMVVLPELFQKYHVEKEKILQLLQIPQYFDLEVYTNNRMQKYLDSLLEQLAVIVCKYSDSKVLDQVSYIYRYLCDDEYAVYDKALTAVRLVVDTCCKNLNFALDIFKEAGDEAEDVEIFNVVQSLKRLTSLYALNDLSSCDLYAEVNSILVMQQDRPDSVPESIVAESLKFIHYDLIYGLSMIKNQRDEKDADDASRSDSGKAIGRLRHRLKEFFHICTLLLAQSPSKDIRESSYTSMCDLLVIFAPQLATKDASLEVLVQQASEPLQHGLIEYVEEFVFDISKDNKEDENEDDRLDDLHRRRSLLAAICKLFIFNLMDLKLATFVFQQYIRFYTDYGDIIRETINRCRHANQLACTQILVYSLMTLFLEVLHHLNGALSYDSPHYSHLKELARRFALTFGVNQIKSREAVAGLHKEGILFSLKRDDNSLSEDNSAPPNLAFLNILAEFSSKLMKQDRKTVVEYLDKNVRKSVISGEDSMWPPLVDYRNSLIANHRGSTSSVPAKPSLTPRKKLQRPQHSSTAEKVTRAQRARKASYSNVEKRLRNSTPAQKQMFDSSKAGVDDRKAKGDKSSDEQQKVTETVRQLANIEENIESNNQVSTRNRKAIELDSETNYISEPVSDENLSVEDEEDCLQTEMMPNGSNRDNLRMVPPHLLDDNVDELESLPSPKWRKCEKQKSLKKQRSSDDKIGEKVKGRRGLFRVGDKDESTGLEELYGVSEFTGNEEDIESKSTAAVSASPEKMLPNENIDQQLSKKSSPIHLTPSYDFDILEFEPFETRGGKMVEEQVFGDELSTEESITTSSEANPFQNIVSKAIENANESIASNSKVLKVDLDLSSSSSEISDREFNELQETLSRMKLRQYAEEAGYRKEKNEVMVIKRDCRSEDTSKDEDGTESVEEDIDEDVAGEGDDFLGEFFAEKENVNEQKESCDADSSEKEDSEFGIFLNVVSDIRANTSILSQSTKLSDSEEEN